MHYTLSIYSHLDCIVYMGEHLCTHAHAGTQCLHTQHKNAISTVECCTVAVSNAMHLLETWPGYRTELFHSASNQIPTQLPSGTPSTQHQCKHDWCKPKNTREHMGTHTHMHNWSMLRFNEEKYIWGSTQRILAYSGCDHSYVLTYIPLPVIYEYLQVL